MNIIFESTSDIFYIGSHYFNIGVNYIISTISILSYYYKRCKRFVNNKYDQKIQEKLTIKYPLNINSKVIDDI